jgi:filamentous hemagglutinin
LGIVVQGKGSFNALLQDDFNVNQSRVFTLGGGDVLVWASLGDIDAGRGAKSSLAAPNPLFSVDQNGDLVVTTPPPVSGSGIRTSAPPLGGEPGDVTLAAPGGIVNASEAGIAGNNVTISATAVLGAGNISIGGIGSGVPTTSNVSIAAGLTGVSNLNANVSQVAQAAADMGKDDARDDTNKQHQLGTIKVELLGFGDGSASINDDKAAEKKS